MNVAFTLACGDKKWGQLAINWVLSIKHTFPKVKTALIYTASAIEGIEDEIERFFDYAIQISDAENPIELAFKTKTEFYDIITKLVPEAESYLFMDADTIMLSGRSVDEFFEELKDVDFTMWCNDVYDFATKTRMRDNYTFWCEPEDVIEYDKAINRFGGKMPQVNSSFIYFKKTKVVELIFLTAKSALDIKGIEIKKYKGTIPDEFCFNVALAHLQKLPHQIPYYPIFFSFASEHFEEQYIRNWKAIGFAGDNQQSDAVTHLYNHNVAYFREQFDIEERFVVGLAKDKAPKDKHPLIIEPIRKRTIYRRDEVINSGGGIFNPDGIYIKYLGYVTIFRKEANMDFYKVGHNQATAIPHVHILGKDRDDSFELEYMNKSDNVRFEDFRMVGYIGIDNSEQNILQCTHTVIENNLTTKMTAKIGISLVLLDEKKLFFNTIVALPIETSKIEKNWVFFNEGIYMYCLYSISPYILFRYELGNIESAWEQISVFQPDLDWFHKDQRICNSTRPVLIGDEYLMLFHTREEGIYFQGAVIINKETKEITHYTRNSIPIKVWGEGFQPNLIYVSGMLYVEEKNLLRIFFGESDSHSCSNDYNAEEFIAMVKQYPVHDNQSVLNLLQ